MKPKKLATKWYEVDNNVLGSYSIFERRSKTKSKAAKPLALSSGAFFFKTREEAEAEAEKHGVTLGRGMV